METELIKFFASVIAIFFVLIPHEFAHAFVAYKNGDATPKMYGRLTLTPIKHLDPIGWIMCIFTGFGWAKPVPIYPYNFKNYRVGLFTTAIAGVSANYIIAFIAFPLYLLFATVLGPIAETEAALTAINIIGTIFFYIFSFSLTIVVFNLLPFNPLDGFRIVESFTREINPVRRFLKNYGLYILIALVVESFVCTKIVQYTDLDYFKYFNLLWYPHWFSMNILGFPIIAMWEAIFQIPIVWPI